MRRSTRHASAAASASGSQTGEPATSPSELFVRLARAPGGPPHERAADKVADTSRGTRLLSETTGRRQFRVQLSRPSQMSTTARNETKRVKRELRLLRVLRVLRLLRQYRLGLSLPLRHQQLCCCLLVCRLGCGLLLRLWMSCGVSPRR